MILYVENNQSIIYSKVNSPKFNKREEWQYKKTLVDGKEIEFCYSYRFQDPLSHDMFSDIFGSSRGFYIYFQLDSQWYKMDAIQEINYLGEVYMDVLEYINKKGTFTTDRMNKRLDGVEELDIAQIELLSENLVRIMKRINDYNPYIEAQVRDGKLLLINKIKGEYVIGNSN